VFGLICAGQSRHVRQPFTFARPASSALRLASCSAGSSAALGVGGGSGPSGPRSRTGFRNQSSEQAPPCSAAARIVTSGRFASELQGSPAAPG
jgi:hypothetical protein